MNIKEMRTSNDTKLREELTKLLQEQFNLRMQSATGEHTHNHEHRRVRKDIARIKTVMTEKSNEGNAA